MGEVEDFKSGKVREGGIVNAGEFSVGEVEGGELRLKRWGRVCADGELGDVVVGCVQNL